VAPEPTVPPLGRPHPEPPGDEGPRRHLSSTPANRVTPERPEWLWERWLPAGSLALLVGRQGAGKSTWAAHVVASLASGRPLAGDQARPPVNAGHLSLEEPDGRVVARLSAAGARLERVHLLGLVHDAGDEGRAWTRPWQLPGDCDLLAERIRGLDLGLVVVDGLGYLIRGDSHNYAVVGSALAGLAQLAAATGAAVLGVTHPPKGSSDPTTAAIGSTAWTSIPRVVIVLGRDPDDEERRVVRVAKTNFAEPPAGWSWRIGSDDERQVGYVADVRVSDVEAGALVAAPETAEERGAVGEAADWLADALSAGPVTAKELLAGGRAAGHAERTVRRAKDRLGIRAVKTGLSGGWMWQLPDSPAEDCQPPPEDGQSP
jgi:putative DNA primase/helicase